MTATPEAAYKYNKTPSPLPSEPSAGDPVADPRVSV